MKFRRVLIRLVERAARRTLYFKLLLRLLGAGAVLRNAARDLADLPGDAPERQVALPVLLSLGLSYALKCPPKPEPEPRKKKSSS